MSSLMDQAQDVFCAELTRIDRLGCNRWLIFTIPSTEGGQWKNSPGKLIIPADYMPKLGVLIASDGRWGKVGAIDTEAASLPPLRQPGRQIDTHT
jgi:hypothetical protein